MFTINQNRCSRSTEYAPGQYAICFHCKTRLIETFREHYGDMLQFESNRAIIFDMEASVPVDEVKHCISLALSYHKVKHLPLLGV